ncbi:hypothetical protein ACO0LB_06170 [Undibacterium sp. SXout7W]|uniref:hypothetical protein n=1 Tax=Undibacterium sp. SXout7W TaxID=3413049 RepID=UPI003BF06660
MLKTPQAPSNRAPRIKNAIRTPIALSPEELDVANEYAASQDRSRSSFMRSMYLRGLKQFEDERQ